MDSPSDQFLPFDPRSPGFGESTGAGRSGFYIPISDLASQPDAPLERMTAAWQRFKRRMLRRPGRDSGVLRVNTSRARARSSHRRVVRTAAKTASTDSDGEPPPAGLEIVVSLTVDRESLHWLADQLGALAADAWLDGKWELPS